jgi:hypothetical protein
MLSWGDGTQVAITQPVMTLQKLYPSNGTYTITVTVSWTGHTTNLAVSGNGIKTDTVQVGSSCDGPVITNQPSNLLVFAGATAPFTVGVSSEFPVSYQWYFNLTNAIALGGTSATLTLSTTPLSLAGSYSVVVTNAYGSATSTVATLTVVAPVATPPSIMQQPLSVITNQGSNVTFTVVAAGTPPLGYQWQFNGANIAGSTASSYILSSPTLINIGYYSVAVSNAAGATNSGKASLTFLDIKTYAGLTITSPVTTNYDIQAIGAIAETNWTTLTNVTVGQQPYLYFDYDSPDNPVQFYRARVQP